MFHYGDFLTDLRNLFQEGEQQPEGFIREFLDVGEKILNSNGTIDVSSLRNTIFRLPRFKGFKSTDQQVFHTFIPSFV